MLQWSTGQLLQNHGCPAHLEKLPCLADCMSCPADIIVPSRSLGTHVGDSHLCLRSPGGALKYACHCLWDLMWPYGNEMLEDTVHACPQTIFIGPHSPAPDFLRRGMRALKISARILAHPQNLGRDFWRALKNSADIAGRP